MDVGGGRVLPRRHAVFFHFRRRPPLLTPSSFFFRLHVYTSTTVKQLRKTLEDEFGVSLKERKELINDEERER